MDLHLTLDDNQETTMGNLVDALVRIECIYNIFAFMSDGSEPDHFSEQKQGLDQKVYQGPQSVFEDIGFIGLSQSIVDSLQQSVALRGRIDTRLQLHVNEIRTGSINIRVSGIAEAINALARIFDPQQRAVAREQLRHDSTMNHLQEEQTRAAVLISHLRLTEEFQVSKERMIQRYVNHGYSRESAEGAVEVLLLEASHQAFMLRLEGADLVAIPRDTSHDANA